jgi:glutathione S-transferase
MKLYYTVNSPYARKVRVVLAERGIAHEAVTVNLDEAPAEFTRANPNLKVPCLVDGKRELFESNLIVDYLLKQGGGKAAGGQPPLAGTVTRPEQHWDDLLVLVTIETLLDSAANAYGLKRDNIQPAQSGTLRRELRRIEAELDWLEARVTPQGFVPGVFSIQDLNLAIALLWLDFRKPAPWRGRKKLEALVARSEGRPSLQATKPGP